MGNDLQKAAYNGDLARVKWLLGIDMDEADSDGCTALWYAADKGYLAIVRCLVEQGADKEKANKHGQTPLHIASWQGHLKVVRYLLEQGANSDKATNGGLTPLSSATWNGHLTIAMLLMSYGEDLNARHKVDEALQRQVEKSRVQIEQALRKRIRGGKATNVCGLLGKYQST